MRLTLLGTGDARQVPVYGCQCQACQAAHADPGLRRRPCCALVELGDQRWLIDSGLPDLTERVSANIHRAEIAKGTPTAPTSGSVHTPMPEGRGVDGGVRARMKAEDRARATSPSEHKQDAAPN